MQTQICGLGREIMKQFEQWALTTAEAEVGMLLLKGLRHGEIATLRGTSEATVRQQARSIYLKSGLAGKSAFSAYFLEDLLPAKAPTGGWVDPADALNSQRKDVRPEQPRDSEVVKKP